MTDPLVLKKYSNRRLYDTRKSQYVTLEDVAELIRSGEQVQIQDATSGEDVTAFILTQIVLEAAKRRNSLLPVPVLHLIIRFGDNALADFFDKYFQKTLQNYLATKAAFDQQFGHWLDMGLNMSKKLPDMMAGTASMETMMEMFGYSAPSSPANKDTERHPPGSPDTDDGDSREKK
jgi:polyhydroxyalkanoate synthesis repressor PhaR